MKSILKILLFPMTILLGVMRFFIALVFGFFHSILFKNNKF